MRITSSYYSAQYVSSGKKPDVTNKFSDILQNAITSKLTAAAQPQHFMSCNPVNAKGGSEKNFIYGDDGRVYNKDGIGIFIEEFDPMYDKLSGDELYAYIVKKYNGGAVKNPGVFSPDMFQPFTDMLNNLVFCGLMTKEQSWAIHDARALQYSLSLSQALDKSGLSFNSFIANYRFSLADVLAELMTERIQRDEKGNIVEIMTAEGKQAAKDVLNKIIAVMQ